MKLYRVPFSTNVERVALALAYKGLDAEPVDMPYDDRTLVKEISGQELVPVLVDDGEVVADSTEILRHLERKAPDPPLWPRESARRAELDVFLDWFDRVWKRPPNLIEGEYRSEQPDEERIQRLGGAMTEYLDLFEALLDGREFLFGDFSAADCAAFPFLKYGTLGLPAGDEHRFHQILVEWQPTTEHPRVEAWVHRVNERPRVPPES